MSKHECALFGVVVVAAFGFFGFMAYAVHAENIACIQAGGTMKNRACHFASRKEGD